MKVFVTGASGFVGGAVLEQLQAAGHFIRILARHPQSARIQAAADRFRAEIHPGDILDSQALEPGLPGVEAVIHLVGIISEVGAATFENIHVRGTQSVVEAMQKANVPRLAHISALGARPQAISRYHQSKWAAEEIVRQSGLDWTIFRPSIVYGPGDEFVNLFAKLARRLPVLPVMGTGQGTLQPVSVETVASCFVKAITEPKAIRQTVDLCSEEVLTFDEVLDRILHVTGQKRWKCHIPMALARGLAAGMEQLFAALHKAPPLNRDQLLMLEEKTVGNPQLAKDLFGIKLVPFREGIAQYLPRR